MIAVDYEGKRYDMGNKFGILEANIEVGLNHPDTKDALKAYIKKIAESLNESAFESRESFEQLLSAAAV